VHAYTVRIIRAMTAHSLICRMGVWMFSLEAEKHSHYRHSPLSTTDGDAFAEISHDVPDVLCRGGWWLGDGAIAGGSTF